MATYNSTQYAKVANIARDGVQLTTKEFGGDVLCASFDYTMVGTEDVGDIINLALLPPGAKILHVYLTVGDTGTFEGEIKVGTDNDDNCVSADVIFSAAASLNLYGNNLPVYTTTEEEVLTITLTVLDVAATAGDTIRGWVLYAN